MTMMTTMTTDGPALAQDSAAIRIPPPITAAERQARIARAQAALREADLGALLVEPGASLIYYTGVRWGPQRAAHRRRHPRRPASRSSSTPFFEEPSVRESLGIPAEIMTWQEDEDPLALIARTLRARGIAAPVAAEETVRFFAADGLARATGMPVRPGAAIVPASSA
jgi:Xaa-Pro dipeptidase